MADGQEQTHTNSIKRFCAEMGSVALPTEQFGSQMGPCPMAQQGNALSVSPHWTGALPPDSVTVVAPRLMGKMSYSLDALAPMLLQRVCAVCRLARVK